MKKYILNKIIVVVFAILTTTSCSEYLELEPEIQKVITEGFTSEEDVLASITGAYSLLAKRSLYGEAYPASDYGTDEGYHAQSWTAAEPWIRLNNHNAETNSVRSLWVGFYQVINQCNTVISRLNNTTASGFNVSKEKHIAEAKFLRGLSYLQLTVLFNEVPLRLTPSDSSISNDLAPAELSVVYNQIIEDFKYASINLPHSNSSDYIPGMANKMAAHGMMARTYMKMAGAPYSKTEHYKDAMDQCDIIMKDGFHEIVVAAEGKGYSQLFKNYIGNSYNLKESLFEISYSNLVNVGLSVSGRHGIFNGMSFQADKALFEFRNNVPYSQPTVIPSPVFDDVYDDADKRKSWNIPGIKAWNGKPSASYSKALSGSNTIGKFRRWEPLFPDDLVMSNATAPFYTILEDVTIPNASATGVNFPILRFADVLLMFAEASNAVNGAPTSEGINALNRVRERAGLDVIGVSNPLAIAGHDEFLSEIQDERLRELCFEGLRKFDLVRWGIYSERLTKLEESIIFNQNYTGSSSHEIYLKCVTNFDSNKHLSLPYPKQEVDLNNLLNQKPGW